MIDVATLKSLMEYNPATGELIWKARPVSMFPDERAQKIWNTKNAGKPALAALGNGYRHGHVFKKGVLAHRACWAIYHGEWPTNQIDHINGCRTDNRIENLRDVTNSENSRNSSLSRRNKSGVTGVIWFPQTNRWQSYIRSGGKQRHIGYFTDFSDAVAARRQAEADLGFHENHGKAL